MTMERREFLKGVAATAAIGIAASQVASAKPKVYPWIEQALESRRRGQTPNYIEVHTCSQCKRDYLCPDRFTMPECGPARFIREKGWGDGRSSGCLPCVAKLDQANTDAWWEAHKL